MDELNNCCGTTCDKRIATEHFNDALAINARLSAENEQLKRQINALVLANNNSGDTETNDFFNGLKKDVYAVLLFLAIINFILWFGSV